MIFNRAMTQRTVHEAIIVGAGAAGMMCAIHAAAKTRHGGGAVLVVDHADVPGEKIRISGGGRCNFTNLEAAPDRFLSRNPHFAKSALKRYTQWDFIDLVQRYGIPYHEKTLGQLFCDTSAQDIIAMLRTEMDRAGAVLDLSTTVHDIAQSDSGFALTLERAGQRRTVETRNLVIASGGLSIPKMGATDFGYRAAEQFGHQTVDVRPALVPLTFDADLRDRFKALSGVSVPARVSCNGTGFEEALLFTHRGLSGPAILQVSSYWREGDAVDLRLVPHEDVMTLLKTARQQHGKRATATVLSEIVPKRLAADIVAATGLAGQIGDMSDEKLHRIAGAVQGWHVTPTGSEGYRTAEVTAGGVDTADLDSKTMQSKKVPGLYFIGEVVDVTGWLGGYNFQWAWSSGWAAGTAISGT